MIDFFRCLALSIVVLSTGCDQARLNGDALAELRTLEVENAPADARAALERGDTRLIAVYGITVEVPGTDYTREEAEAMYGVRILEGTSDEPAGREEADLNLRARRYAASYNQVIVSAHGALLPRGE